MAQNETNITIVGTLVADPDLRFTQSGDAVANFRVASNPRQFNRETNQWEDLEALFLQCTVWRQAAENVAESLQKGMRVIVTGRLRQKSFETREGEKRTAMTIEVDEVGPSLSFATAQITRNPRNNAPSSPQSGQQGATHTPPRQSGFSPGNQHTAPQTTWGTPAGANDEQPPF